MLTNTVGCIERTPSVITLAESSGDSLKGAFLCGPAPFCFATRLLPVCAFVNGPTDGSGSFFHSNQWYRLPWTPCKI